MRKHDYNLYGFYLAVALLLGCLFVGGCAILQSATPPKPSNAEQSWLLATHETKAMMAAVNDAIELGLISPINHMEVERKVIEVHRVLNVSRGMLDAGDVSSAQGQLRIITSLLLNVRALIGGPQ